MVSSGARWAAIAAACLASLGCGPSEAESTAGSSSDAGETTTSSPATTSTAAETVPPYEKLPLYGFYVRDVPHVEQEPPAHPDLETEWVIDFKDSYEGRAGVLEVWYHGKREGWGRAYRYSSDDTTLRLGGATRPKDVEIRLGGFECRLELPATYAWSRFDRNYTLRLKAIREPCAARRAILEGEWHFVD